MENSLSIQSEKKDGVFAPMQVILPSMGKLYSKDHPLFNAQYIEVKEMTAREEDILTSRILLRKGIAIDKVLENCIVNKKINQADLLVGDRNTILLALRISGYGPDYNIQTTCPVCNAKQIHNFNLAAVKINALDVMPVEEGINEFEVALPKSQAVIKFKLLSAGEEAEISKAQENYRRATGSEVENIVTSRMMRQILSVNGNSTRQYVIEFINTMHISDSRAFRDYVKKIEPDVVMKENMICKECNEESEIDIPITAEFFWPTGNR